MWYSSYIERCYPYSSMSIYPNSIKPWSEEEEERIRKLGFDEENPWSEEEEENQKDEDKEPRAEMKKRSANKQTHAKLSIGSGALSFPRLEWFEARFKSKGFTCIKDDKQNYLRYA